MTNREADRIVEEMRAEQGESNERLDARAEMLRRREQNRQRNERLDAIARQNSAK